MKTATLIYMFCHSGSPNYFRAFVNPRKSFYNAMNSSTVPQFIPSVHKSTTQFGVSLAYGIPKVLNELQDDIYFTTTLLSI